MAVETWLILAAEALWERCGGAPTFPRDFDDRARGRLDVRTVPVPRLSVACVVQHLARFGIDLPGAGKDRHLRGCLVVIRSRRFLFYDPDDPDEERRYTIAHELAHLWLEVIEPRERVRARLGESALQVLDGLREPTPAERVQSVFRYLPLAPPLHLLERDADLGVVRGRIALAESRADRLALELLAPEAEGLRRLPPAAAWGTWLPEAGTRLAAYFGLPAGIAEAYARRLGPSVGAMPSFRERLAGVF